MCKNSSCLRKNLWNGGITTWGRNYVKKLNKILVKNPVSPIFVHVNILCEEGAVDHFYLTGAIYYRGENIIKNIIVPKNQVYRS